MHRRHFLQTAFGATATAALGSRAPLWGAKARQATDIVSLGPDKIKLTRLAIGTGTKGGSIQRLLGVDGVANMLRWGYDQGIFFCWGVRWGLAEKNHIENSRRYGISIGIEPHQFITTKTEGLMRVATLVKSPMLRVNYDTGNAWLGGEDPYEGLKTVGKLLVHMHAKDISVQQSEKDRGVLMGTPVGCACGDGVIDWTKVIGILKESGYDGALSVECGTPAQAVRSLEHLTKIVNG